MLQQFINEVAAWLKAGRPPHPVFKEDKHLCVTLYDYQGQIVSYEAEELCDRFQASGLKRGFPFNKYHHTFFDEERNGTVWLNQQRVDWVLSQATE